MSSIRTAVLLLGLMPLGLIAQRPAPKPAAPRTPAAAPAPWPAPAPHAPEAWKVPVIWDVDHDISVDFDLEFKVNHDLAMLEFHRGELL